MIDLLSHALDIARTDGVATVTAEAISRRAGVNRQTVRNALGNARAIRTAVLKHDPSLPHPPSLDRYETMRIHRNRTIFAAAVQLARESGLAKLTRERIAHVSGFAPSTVSQYGPTLRQDIVEHALAVPIVPIILDALALRMIALQQLPDGLRELVLS